MFDLSSTGPGSDRKLLSTGSARRTYGVLVWMASMGLGCAALWRGGQQFLDPGSLLRVPFHGDESLHLAQTDLFDLFFLKRDWHHAHWFREFYGPDQPHWGHYLIGWQLARKGLPRPACALYDFGLTFGENRRAGAVPSAESLLAARQLMGLLGMGTLAGFVLLGFAVGRPLTGAVAANFLAANYLFKYCVSRAMLEAPLVLGCTVILLLAALTWRCLRSTSSWSGPLGYFLVVLGGVGLGMVLGTKLLGGLAALVWCLVMASLWAEPAVRRPHRRWRPLAASVLAGAVAGPLFYLTNPYLFSYPNDQPTAKLGLFRGLTSMLDHAEFRQAGQQWIYEESAIISATHRIKLVVAKTLFDRTAPQFPGPREPAEAASPALPFAGLEDSARGDVFQPPGSYATLGGRAWLPLDALLALVGCGLLTYQTVRRLRAGGRLDPGVILVVWFGITLVATCWWLPLDWDRYYLLPVTATQLIMGAAVAAPFEWYRFRRSLLRALPQRRS